MLFSIILQNTVDKQIYTYTQENTASDNSIYYSFDVDFSDLQDGEYKLYLIENKDGLPIYINQNNVEKSEIDTNKYILINKGEILANKERILIISGDDTYKTPIEIITTEIVRIGEYTAPNTSYNKKQSYIQYGE